MSLSIILFCTGIGCWKKCCWLGSEPVQECGSNVKTEIESTNAEVGEIAEK